MGSSVSKHRGPGPTFRGWALVEAHPEQKRNLILILTQILIQKPTIRSAVGCFQAVGATAGSSGGAGQRTDPRGTPTPGGG
jgi:hypothetical protein